MNHDKYYQRGHDDGLNRRPYNRKFNGYHYYHGFKAGQHARASLQRRPHEAPARRNKRLRRIGRLCLAVGVVIAKAIFSH